MTVFYSRQIATKVRGRVFDIRAEGLTPKCLASEANAKSGCDDGCVTDSF